MLYKTLVSYVITGFTSEISARILLEYLIWRNARMRSL